MIVVTVGRFTKITKVEKPEAILRHETSKVGAKSATADSCFGLIGPRQCSAALGGPATSTEDLRHQGA